MSGWMGIGGRVYELTSEWRGGWMSREAGLEETEMSEWQDRGKRERESETQAQ